MLASPQPGPCLNPGGAAPDEGAGVAVSWDSAAWGSVKTEKSQQEQAA